MFGKHYALFFTHPFEDKFVAFVGNDDNVRIFWDKDHFQHFLNSQKIKIVFSYGLQDVIRRLNEIPLDIVFWDIQVGSKLLCGTHKNNYKLGKEPWEIRNILDKFVDDNVRSWLNSLLNNKVAGLYEWTHGKHELINALFVAFRSATNWMVEGLQSSEEFVRYSEVEVPIYNIFLKTEYEGIRINNDAIGSLVIDLSHKYYRSIKTLELKYDFIRRIHSSLKVDDIRDSISADQYDELLKEDTLWDGINNLPEEDEFLSNLSNAYSHNFTRRELYKYYIEENDKIFPRFNIMGTVTGRIIIESPGIQWLKRIYRHIFVPQNGMKFIYADYSQFEPGILAELSSNETLKSLYNSGDIYSNLSNVMFGDCEGRDIAKKTLLSFFYGMSSERIIRNIVNNGRNPSIEGQIEMFFEQFSDLECWKNDLIENAKIVGYAQSLCGNKRYTKEKGQATMPEKRWIPNHYIQSTASLVFKTALISISKQIPSARLLVPMHDAILLEVDLCDEDTTKQQVEEIMKKSFNQFCPSIIPRIKFQDFSQT